MLHKLTSHKKLCHFHLREKDKGLKKILAYQNSYCSFSQFHIISESAKII